MTRPSSTFHLAVDLASAAPGLTITPELVRAAFPARASAFMLEGGGEITTLHRASFIGAEPVATFRAQRTRAEDDAGRKLACVEIESAGGRRDTFDAVDPFLALRRFLAENAVAPDVFDARYPFSFRCGLVGYIGYECGQTLERLPGITRPSIGMPDMALSLHRWVIATSRETGRSWLSVLGVGPTDDDARRDAEATRDRIVELLIAAPPEPPALARPRIEVGSRSIARSSPISASEYKAKVGVAKDHIRAGDTFEICLTTAHRVPLAQDQAWSLFRELCRSNPAPFAAFLDLPEGAVVSSSPERFLALDANRRAESRPIKGTRPRGATPAEDARLARELASSEKDRAENAMIVDLVRNDLGRVCRFGTVEVPDLFAVESYATVHQLVSTIRGELAPECDAVDLLRACFPPGSMTGAPKIEAMRILEELEPVERGVYSGALGWLDLGGAMDLSVVIRTVVVKDDVATFSVGGAVVADSDPEDEHQETEHKARALVRALERVARRAEARLEEAKNEAEIELSP